jgi:RNA polymerase sigma-70 factor (ECF subfamily)
MKEDFYYIEKVINGERDYYSFIVEKYQSLLFNTIKKVVGNRTAAEDITQDAFFKAYKSLKNYDQERPFYPYLLRIAMNCAKDYLKKENKLISTDSEIIKDESVNDADKISEMYEIIYKLPGQYREVILYFYKDGKSIKEIALETGESTDNVKVKLFRARKLLLKFYEEL